MHGELLELVASDGTAGLRRLRITPPRPAATVRSGLAYIKGRYGTPCAAWDHVRSTGEY